MEADFSDMHSWITDDWRMNLVHWRPADESDKPSITIEFEIFDIPDVKELEAFYNAIGQAISTWQTWLAFGRDVKEDNDGQ